MSENAPCENCPNPDEDGCPPGRRALPRLQRVAGVWKIVNHCSRGGDAALYNLAATWCGLRNGTIKQVYP